MILKSKSTTDLPVKIGDLVQVFIKLQHEKRGTWSSAKPVLAYDKKISVVTIPVGNGRKINAAVEDVRFAITDYELAIKYQAANDQLNSVLDTWIYSISNESKNEDDDDTKNSEPEELSTTHDLCFGDKIEVYWPLDDKLYPGSTSEYEENTGKHIIAYGNGQNEN